MQGLLGHSQDLGLEPEGNGGSDLCIKMTPRLACVGHVGGQGDQTAVYPASWGPGLTAIETLFSP